MERGFTVAELLITIAVISVFASIAIFALTPRNNPAQLDGGDQCCPCQINE